MPIVVVEIRRRYKRGRVKKYVIVDGYHRHLVAQRNSDIFESIEGKMPCSIIKGDAKELRAATIRHNRARGKHSIKGMSSMVFDLLDAGWTDDQVCNELGMEPEELIRVKHITGFAKLFEDVEYRKAWVTRSQIKIKRTYEKEAANV